MTESLSELGALRNLRVNFNMISGRPIEESRVVSCICHVRIVNAPPPRDARNYFEFVLKGNINVTLA